MFEKSHRVIQGISEALAFLGGFVLSAVILLTCLSILGRTATSMLYSDLVQTGAPGFAAWALSTGIGPIKGDYELLEAAMPFVIFAFLPLCQISAGHATVDVFTSGFSDRTKRWLGMVIELVFAAVVVLVVVQLYDGMQTMMRRKSLTFILQFPLWWAYALALVPAIIAAVVAVYMALVRSAEAIIGAPLAPETGKAEH